jgi:inorganic pyrophosphatase
MQIHVFVQNEANSNQKNFHNEKTLEHKETVAVSRKYPYPYGFVLNTTSGDGNNLACFILTKQPLKTGQIVACEPIGMMEQIEDGKEDHNVLAVLAGEEAEITDEVKDILTEFVSHVFEHVERKFVEVGRFFGRKAAMSLIEKCRDKPGLST